jgi:hypothetical protein
MRVDAIILRSAGLSLGLGLLASGCLREVSVVHQVEPGPECARGGVCEVLTTAPVDKLDLLFVIDNTASMGLAQSALRAQFPALLRTLGSGQRSEDDPNRFPPVRDIHLGVVSSDMGTLMTDALSGCAANGGDDGRLLHAARGDGCKDSYPQFLSQSPSNPVDTLQLASDLSCIADLGTNGCGVRQPLDAAFKAIWPALLTDARGNLVDPNPFSFVASDAVSKDGHGDVPESDGGNLGFLRTDPAAGPSALAIVVLSDGDDCSNINPSKLVDRIQAEPGHDIGAACAASSTLLFDPRTRYAAGLKLLSVGREDLVVFAGIVGVPPDLVTGDVDLSQPAARDAYYAQVLSDPRMQAASPEASCSHRDQRGNEISATAPRRIVQLAQDLGESAIIQSICQDDMADALAPVVDAIAGKLGERCLASPLQPKDGRVDCDLIWQLPVTGAFAHCSERPFLKRVSDVARATNAAGGENCQVTQLAVDDQHPDNGEGWYYDDFSSDVQSGEVCSGARTQRIVYTPTVTPPAAVRALLDCSKTAGR